MVDSWSDLILLSPALIVTVVILLAKRFIPERDDNAENPSPVRKENGGGV